MEEAVENTKEEDVEVVFVCEEAFARRTLRELSLNRGDGELKWEV